MANTHHATRNAAYRAHRRQAHRLAALQRLQDDVDWREALLDQDWDAEDYRALDVRNAEDPLATDWWH